MTLFTGLIERSFHAAPVAMWSEVFSAWASLRGRFDDESTEQLAEYDAFLRGSVVHLKRLRDATAAKFADHQAAAAAEIVLQKTFGHVARLIANAEEKVATGKLPGGKESAVLDRQILVELLGDEGSALLDEAIARERPGRAGH